MKNLTITADRVVDAANKHPKAKEILEDLFPEAFENDKVFCRIGVLIRRKGYKNFYTVFKWNGEVRMLNITHNTFWDADRNLKVSRLKDREGSTLTLGEFRELTGRGSDDFEVFEDFGNLKDRL